MPGARSGFPAGYGVGEQRLAGPPRREPLCRSSALAPAVSDLSPRGTPHRSGRDEPLGTETGMAAGAAGRAAVRLYL